MSQAIKRVIADWIGIDMTPQMLARALPAIRSAMHPNDELIVVDSASTDTDVAVIAADIADSVVRTDLPGLGRARNAGWTRARRRIVARGADPSRAGS